MPSSKQSQSSITIRCTAQEHRQIEQQAQSYGMSLSEYVRFVSMNAKIEVNIEKSE